MARTSFPLSGSQSRIVPSSPPVAKSFPSGLREVALNVPRCRRVSRLQVTTPLTGGGLVTSARSLSASPGLRSSLSAPRLGIRTIRVMARIAIERPVGMAGLRGRCKPLYSPAATGASRWPGVRPCRECFRIMSATAGESALASVAKELPMGTTVRLTALVLVVLGLASFSAFAEDKDAKDKEKNDAKVVTTKSGLKYIDLKEGTGDKAQ